VSDVCTWLTCCSGCRSHLFLHVIGCVVVVCEVFALASYLRWVLCRGGVVK
jgi:hypothetical protein